MTIVSFPPQTMVEYPESDGKPMAETMKHILVITYLLNVLMAWFRDRADMYVGGNNLIYYVEGFPKKFFAPDVYLIPGLDKTPRRVLKLWEIKRAPAVIFEITSRATWEDDLGDKMELYAQLGVREYFVYDVEHEELEPPLRGFRLAGFEYEPMQPDPDGRIYSAELQLQLQEIDGTLRLINPRTGEILKTYTESEEARQEAEELAHEAGIRADQEYQARLEAEAEAARLRAELEKLRGKQD
ncbi:MAG: Uma2 family endonuclease [Chloroflexi bacterium]|nr:Uma2 family endonuclease [Chloroflexota bacterium]